MAEEVNRENSDFGSNSTNIGERKIRETFTSVLITLSLIVGPILLPIVLIKPDWFSEISYIREISISITILFILASTAIAYLREKKIENRTS